VVALCGAVNRKDRLKRTTIDGRRRGAQNGHQFTGEVNDPRTSQRPSSAHSAPALSEPRGAARRAAR